MVHYEILFFIGFIYLFTAEISFLIYTLSILKLVTYINSVKQSLTLIPYENAPYSDLLQSLG